MSAESKAPVVVVALTADPSEPEVVLESRKEVESDGGQPNAIRWTRWQSLARVFEQLQQDPDVSDVSRRLIGELLRFMEMRGVRGFTGLDMEEINLFRETWSRAPGAFQLRSAAEELGARTTERSTRLVIARDLTGTERAPHTAWQTGDGVRPSWSSGLSMSNGRRFGGGRTTGDRYICSSATIFSKARRSAQFEAARRGTRRPAGGHAGAELAAQTESRTSSRRDGQGPPSMGFRLGTEGLLWRRVTIPESLRTGDRFAWRLELMDRFRRWSSSARAFGRPRTSWSGPLARQRPPFGS